MNKVWLIAELGSCHLGNFRRIVEAIDRCKRSGIDALKLQLFPNEQPYVPTNVYLPLEMFAEAFRYGQSVGLPVSASVFDEKSFLFLLNLKPDFIKFSYSKKDSIEWISETIESKTEVIVSCDVMTDQHPLLENPLVHKLYCIPEYPVRYNVAFDDLFSTETVRFEGGIEMDFGPRFEGFSDHTLGIRQTRLAIDAGAMMIEKHIRLGYEDEFNCPDGRFAVLLEEFASVR